jgi:hypothetical protein
VSKKDCDAKSLEAIFSNKQLSGGGPLLDLELDKTKGVALITYQSSKG